MTDTSRALSPREQRAAEKDAQKQADREAKAAADQAAAFAASPIGQALAAFERGDRFFQTEILVSALAGGASSWGSSYNRIRRVNGATDILGQIEEIGWQLEHAGWVFVETGSTSTNRPLSTGQGVVTKGSVRGVYLFRRAQPEA